MNCCPARSRAQALADGSARRRACDASPGAGREADRRVGRIGRLVSEGIILCSGDFDLEYRTRARPQRRDRVVIGPTPRWTSVSFHIPSTSHYGLERYPDGLERYPVVILGLDPRISLSPYWLNSSHSSVVRDTVARVR